MNMFYKIWTDSEEGRNSYERCSVHWSMVPGRDEDWKDMTVQNSSLRQFEQEFESISAQTLININNTQVFIGDLYEQLKKENQKDN